MTTSTAPEIAHRFIQVNGIRMHIAEAGSGPLVVLVHGFPELWYDWRRLLPVLAAAGYHAVAPDMRGYGQTDAPPDIESYSQHDLVGDVVDLVHGLGEHEAVIIGHDWGSIVTASCAIVRPDMFRAVALHASVYVSRFPGAAPTTLQQKRAGESGQFYQWYFQQPGVAEQGVRHA